MSRKCDACEPKQEVLEGKRPFQFRILDIPKPDAFDGMSCMLYHVELSHVVAQLRVMYWSLRPNAEKMRAEKLNEANAFISNTTTVKLFKKAFKFETKKYALGYGATHKEDGEASINVNSLLNLAIQECGVVHWIFSDSLCQALGREKTKQFSLSYGMLGVAASLNEFREQKTFFCHYNCALRLFPSQ